MWIAVRSRRRLVSIACGMSLVVLAVTGGGAVGADGPGIATPLLRVAQAPVRDDIAPDPEPVAVPDDTPAPDSAP